MKRLLVTLACLAAPAAAQDLAFSPEPTLACLRTGQPVEVCAGEAANACTEANGYSTIAQSACADAEARWWDVRLNAAYQEAMAKSRRADSENAAYAPSQAEGLRAMQRAWIPFRDETCSFEATWWGGGTGAGPAYAFCILVMTARQTHYLETIGLE